MIREFELGARLCRLARPSNRLAASLVEELGTLGAARADQTCLKYAESRQESTKLNLKSETGALTLTYQVIFATSFVVEELDISEYTIGDKYSPNNKSLKNV